MTWRNYFPLIGFALPTTVIGFGVVIPRSCIAGINELTIGFASTIVGACVTYVLGLRQASPRTCEVTAPKASSDMDEHARKQGSAVKRPIFIARQAAQPSGILGRVIAWIMARETAELNEQAVTLLSLSPTDQVLEVGFGHGRTVQSIAAAVPNGRVTGIDVSETMTRLAIRRNRRAVADGRVDLRTANSASLPFDDGQFDKALSVHTLYFWKDPQACLCEIRRVLRPGAYFVLGFTPSNSPRVASFPGEVYTFYDDDQVKAMLSGAGFESVELTRVGEAALVRATASAMAPRSTLGRAARLGTA